MVDSFVVSFDTVMCWNNQNYSNVYRKNLRLALFKNNKEGSGLYKINWHVNEQALSKTRAILIFKEFTEYHRLEI